MAKKKSLLTAETLTTAQENILRAASDEGRKGLLVPRGGSVVVTELVEGGCAVLREISREKANRRGGGSDMYLMVTKHGADVLGRAALDRQDYYRELRYSKAERAQ